MKITKRTTFINASSKYLSDDILFDDVIQINMKVYLEDAEQAVQSSSEIERFPGREKFREDVIKLLEEKYLFDVIEDNYNGKMQKGYFSNREDSISLYVDSYLDLNRLQELSSDPRAKGLEGKMYCFIHIRFSDHRLNDAGDVLHRKFIQDNLRKYVNDEVTHTMEDEEIWLDERLLSYYYHEALGELDDDLAFKIRQWVRRADLYIHHPIK